MGLLQNARSSHSSQHYRSLLSVSEDNVGETNAEIGVLQQSHMHFIIHA